MNITLAVVPDQIGFKHFQQLYLIKKNDNLKLDKSFLIIY